MKTAIAILLQFFLFLAVFAAGIVIGVFDPLQLKWFVTHPTLTTTRYFAPDGLILTLLLYLLILAIEAARKTIRPFRSPHHHRAHSRASRRLLFPFRIRRIETLYNPFRIAKYRESTRVYTVPPDVPLLLYRGNQGIHTRDLRAFANLPIQAYTLTPSTVVKGTPTL